MLCTPSRQVDDSRSLPLRRSRRKTRGRSVVSHFECNSLRVQLAMRSIKRVRRINTSIKIITIPIPTARSALRTC